MVEDWVDRKDEDLSCGILRLTKLLMEPKKVEVEDNGST